MVSFVLVKLFVFNNIFLIFIECQIEKEFIITFLWMRELVLNGQS